MEENMTGAENREAVDTGTAEASPVTGEELFEKYEDGASLDELNAMLTNNGMGGAAENQGGGANGAPGTPAGVLGKRRSDGTEEPARNADGGQSGARPDEESRETVHAETGETNGDGEASEERGTPAKPEKQGERVFTQHDVDYLIGRKTSEVTRKHSALLDDLSSILGVDRSNVINEVRRQRLESEADKQGIVDKELYARSRQLEEVNAQLLQTQQTEAVRQQFLGEVERQRQELAKRAPGFDMAAAVRNPQFNNMLGALYQNPETKERAVELAYNAVFFDDVAKRIAQQEKEKVVASVKSGAARVQEGAAAGSPAASARIDMNKLSDSQIDKITQGILEGKIHNLEDIGGM